MPKGAGPFIQNEICTQKLNTRDKRSKFMQM
jgi:hypothetical protein